MFFNLEAEMARNGMKRANLAGAIGMKTANLSMKMKKKVKFSLEEALKIKDALNTEIPVEILFEWSE